VQNKREDEVVVGVAADGVQQNDFRTVAELVLCEDQKHEIHDDPLFFPVQQEFIDA